MLAEAAWYSDQHEDAFAGALAWAWDTAERDDDLEWTEPIGVHHLLGLICRVRGEPCPCQAQVALWLKEAQ